MKAVLIKPTRIRSLRYRSRVVRTVSAVVVAVVVGGILAAGQMQLPAAEAAGATDSKITVKWTGDDSSAREFQPKRDEKSVHRKDFEKLSITVSQTTGIIDQGIRVSVAGFAQTVSEGTFGQNAQNFVQAMQCWGPDPLAKDFRETCEWGGRADPNALSNGIGTSIYGDNILRVSPVDNDVYAPTDNDVRFLSVDRKPVPGKSLIKDPATQIVSYPILSYFSADTTNEISSARMGVDGTGFFDFETQTADQAPQLGCGTKEHLRCWLVVVPRGTVFGGGMDCSSYPSSIEADYFHGREDSMQGGSPMSNRCDYWDNRIVVPLDFLPVGRTCSVGSVEQRVSGSQLMVGAMSSWQPALCSSLKATYSFSSNPDSVARAQVLDGRSPAAFVGYPVNVGDLQTTDERQLLANTDLTYAPVAISAVVVGFLAEFPGGREESLVLSPRIMAKILTQSYRFTVPPDSGTLDKNFAHLPEQNRKYAYLYQDPDFQALNANFRKFSVNPSIVLPGPAGADAIKQVWRWILADADAVRFLKGELDPWKMGVNPYYLPKGDPNATVPTFDNGEYVVDGSGAKVRKPVGLSNLDGTPMQLSGASLDSFIKADETLSPIKLTNQLSKFDSIQFAPFTDSLLTGARAAFRANPNSKVIWDPSKVTQAQRPGDWVSSGTQVPGQKFMITITDGPSAARYGLGVAGLIPANAKVAVLPDQKGLARALSGLRSTSLDAIKQVDPSATDAAGYPLTMVTYAAINLSKSTVASRTSLGAMLEQVTSKGQVPGTSPGMLPAGYLPLTVELLSQSQNAISAIASYVSNAPTSSPTPKPLSLAKAAPDSGYAGETSDLETLESGMTDGSADPVETANVDSATEVRTPVSASEPFERSGLAVALVFALLGALVAPLLFRGRGIF